MLKKDDTDKILEQEKLHRDNENYKQEIAYIHQNYDLQGLDEKMRSCKKTEEWAEQFMAELTLYFNVIESFMTCNICNRTIKAEEPDGPVMVLPCLHSFCGICHKAKKNKIGSCTACGKEE